MTQKSEYSPSRMPVLSEDGTSIVLGSETISLEEAMAIYRVALSARVRAMACVKAKVKPCDKQCVSCQAWRPSSSSTKK